MRGSHANGEIYGKYSRARTCPQIELLALAIYSLSVMCVTTRISMTSVVMKETNYFYV